MANNETYTFKAGDIAVLSNGKRFEVLESSDGELIYQTVDAQNRATGNPTEITPDKFSSMVATNIERVISI